MLSQSLKKNPPKQKTNKKTPQNKTHQKKQKNNYEKTSKPGSLMILQQDPISLLLSAQPPEFTSGHAPQESPVQLAV